MLVTKYRRQGFNRAVLSRRQEIVETVIASTLKCNWWNLMVKMISFTAYSLSIEGRIFEVKGLFRQEFTVLTNHYWPGVLGHLATSQALAATRPFPRQHPD
jgi:hypothetical protein